ncbi:MAG: efflux RND transporter permease subunit [Rhodanobacteraceae bacterium]
MNLAELSLKRPVTIVMLFVSMTVIGLLAATRLPLEQFPAIDAPFLFVQVPYPGSSPDEVERTITRPVEEALATLPGVKRMQSTSGADSATVFMEFDWNVDIAIKAVQAREKIDAIRDQLPGDVQRYFVQKFSTNDAPILQLRLSGQSGKVSTAYDMLERHLKRPLERIPGVAKVEIQGIGRPEVQIEISSDRLNAHGIRLDSLYQRLKQANFAVSAGQVSEGGLRYRVQPQGDWSSLDSIRSLPINKQGLVLGDIATVRIQPERLDYARRLDGKPAIGVNIYRERTANLVAVGTAVMNEVEQIRHDPQLHGLRVYVMESQADSVTTSLRELGHSGLLGTGLAVLVLFFFLRDWPSTLMVSLAIPLSYAITLGCMYFLGVSLNVLSMMGLLLATGMLVDNAVVVVESIYHWREKYPDRPWYAAIQGTQAVGIAIAAGTFTSIVVFLPNIFGEANDISIFLAQVAISMSIAHLASWLVAVSLVPMCAARLPAPRFIGRESMITRVRSRYGNLVSWTLRHPRWTGFGLLLLLASSVFVMTQTKVDMFDDGESRQLRLNYQLNANYQLRQLTPSILKVERYLDQNKARFEIDSLYSYWDEQGNAQTSILLTKGDQAHKSSHAIMEEIRKGLPQLAVGKVNFDFQGGNNDGIALYLTGDSRQQLRDVAASVVPVLSHQAELRDVHTDQSDASHEASIHVDRIRARNYGFDASEVGNYLAIALRGMPLREFRSGDRELPVWLRFGNVDTHGLDQLAGFSLTAADGSKVPLMSMLKVRTSDSPNSIERNDRRTSLKIVANLASGKTLPEARSAIEKVMQTVSLPPGYGYSFGKAFSRDQGAGKQMLFNTLIALVLVYVVMCAMFESLVFPAAILTTFLFSVFGVFWLFWLTGTVFSIMAAIGILILMGVVVNNGIVMIVHINQLRLSGVSRTQALVEGAQDRLRPIMMTMATAILGMLPLSLAGTQAWSDGPPYYPMARAIAGGLLFSTLVTLIALPCIYAWLDDARMWTRRVFSDAWRGRLRHGRADAQIAADS